MTIKAPRRPAQLARDRLKISELYLAGKLQAEIAEELELNQSTVSRDLAALQKEWEKRVAMNIDTAKARELAKVDQLERTYWDAWVRSCQAKKQQKTRMRGTVKREVGKEKKFVEETPTEQTFITIERVGDQRFLKGVEWCITCRCKILGLEAPTQFSINWRKELEREGIDSSEVFEQLVQSLAEKMEAE